MKPIVLPIAICENGHSVCPTCRRQLRIYPVCRCLFSKMRCLLLENVSRRIASSRIRTMDVPVHRYSLDNIKSHQEQCPHQPFKCPFSIVASENCPWEGKMSAIRCHIEKKRNKPYTITTVTGKYYRVLIYNKTRNGIEWCQAVFTMGQTLFILCKIVHSIIHFCVLHVGLRKKACSYKCTVKINKWDG
jgi:hypothetical protein